MTGNSGKEERRLGPAHWKIKNMENSMISEKPCADRMCSRGAFLRLIKTGFLRISLKTGKLSKNIIHRSKRLYMGDLLKTVYIK